MLTPSCTASLELSTMLCEFEPDDEVILPSFTFVSTANAVVRAGGKPVFVDVRPDTLNMDEQLIEDAIGPRTRAIIPVHYAGVGCEMDEIMDISSKHRLVVIEDAAQAVNAFYWGRALGSIGQLGTYSFHETKNYICGEGGALCINDEALLDRAHIVRDKGTDRQRFLQGEVRKYRWVGVGSSYIPSELVSAFLFGQLEMMEDITDRRRQLWGYYYDALGDLERRELLRRPVTPAHCQTNHHMFYILLPTKTIRDSLEIAMAYRGIQAISHFEPLHSSPMGRRYWPEDRQLPVTDSVAGRLLRLPLFYDITQEQQSGVVAAIREHLESRSGRQAKADRGVVASKRGPTG
jgi:dTDP-4-amino-4,6-dideoxygalactose transaminase